ncbi:hypothetical protein TNCV_3738141 [Trichonephila clavipes]|nr:hypothetical protein TNCV_3738141 [Trichonephila clavipes]
MSFHKNTRKEDLINVLKEIGEQATYKETIIELKTKLEKSAAFKDDPDFVINLLNLSVEDRQAKAERQLQETNSQLEPAFRKELHEENDELRKEKYGYRSHALNQIETSISNQNDFLFNELQYVDVIVDEIPLRATLDSDVDEASRKYTAFVTETGQYEFLKVPFGLSISSNYFQRYINYVFRELLRDGTLIIYLDDIIIPATDEKEACKKLARVLETASRYGIELNLKKNALSDLLRGTNPFEFGHAQKVAFQNLKNALCSEPVLHLFKEGAKLELHTDACKLGLGAVLLQQGEDGRFYPIHYMSKKTSIQEEKLCSYELEVLAVIEALKKFRNYLLGRKFRIQTDCAAFAKTLDKKELTPKMARWSIFLTDFDYEVVHRPSKQMQHVDALSRHPVTLVTNDELTYKIVNAQESDEYIRTIKKLLQEGKTSKFIVSNKILYKISEDQELLVVPEMMQVDVIKKAHSFGHFAATKTEELVKRDYYLPNMRRCIENVIKNCVECILVNKKRGKGEGFLNPIPKEDLPFTTAQEVIERLKLQQKTFGNPSRVISDKGGAFRSKEFEDYCADEQISNVQITTGVPRGNGEVERIHGVLIPVLTKMSIEDPTKWFKHVDSLQRVLNSVPTRSTKYSPFELLIGIKMKNPEDVMIRNLLEEDSQEQLFQHRDNLRREAKQNILKIQEENRRTYNHLYKKGDLVAIMRTQFGNKLKLRIKYFGPYQVTKMKPHDRYDVGDMIGDHEGPNVTSASADQMKPWTWH